MQSRARMKSVSEPTSQSLRHRRRAPAVALLGLVAISVTGCAGDSATEAAAWSPSGGPRGFVTGLAVSPAKPEIIYATVSDRGLFKSTDGGRTWRRPANTGLPPDLNVQGAPIVGKYSVCCVAVHPDVPMTVYAISGPSSEVVKSTDGGRRWRVTEEFNSVNGLAINPQNPAIVYAVGWQGVFKTRDGGRNWRDASTGLPEDVLTAVALDPQRPERLSVGTEEGDVWKTRNGGRSWGYAGSAGYFDEVLALAIDPDEPETIYAGTDGAGIAKSTDIDPWEAANTGLPGESDIEDDVLSVYALALDARSPETIYAAAGESRVFRSKDAGKSWHSLNAGLENRSVYHLAFGADGRVLYAGTSNGVFAYRSSG